MKAIDRLIIKAKKNCKTDLKLSYGMIYRSHTEPGKWVAQGNMWNGIRCGKRNHKSECITYVCNSIEDAEKALNELSEKYPNYEDVPIITVRRVKPRIIIDDME